MKRRTFTRGAAATALGLVGLSASSSSAAAAEVSLDYEGEAISLEPAADQEVSGTTDFGTGVTLTVRLRSSNASSPFIKSAEATVGEDGGFTATFDMSDIEIGTSFDASVRWNGLDMASASGEVVSSTAGEDESSAPGIGLDYDAQPISYSAAEGQTVSGTSDLSEGTSVSVSVQATGERSFSKDASPSVDADGNFEASFDLSDVDSGTVFLIEVRYDGERRTFAIGEIQSED